jgi:hypothetical protein
MTKSNSETTKSSGSRLRSNLLRGIAVLFPVYLTFIMIRFLIEIFSKPLAPVFRWIMKRVGLAGYPWMIEGFIIFSSFMVTLVLVITVGAVAQRVFGRRIVGFFEKILAKLPVIRTIYRAFRELTRIMTGETVQSYRKHSGLSRSARPFRSPKAYPIHCHCRYTKSCPCCCNRPSWYRESQARMKARPAI